MRRALVTSFVLVVAGASHFGCNVLIGVDEPVHGSSSGSGGAAGAGGHGGEVGTGGKGGGGMGGGNCAPVEADACDGIDNDCNDKVDDLPLITCGEGVCKASVEACVDGKPADCSPGTPTPGEMCDGDSDGIDDNCNGKIDEGCPCMKGQVDKCYSGTADTRNVGECKDGEQTCTASNQWGACIGDVLPAVEACNGKDDDCDGEVDDGFGETTCGVGACQVTVSNCNPKGQPVECIPKDPTDEICNGLDDDCDGSVDEQNPGGGTVCMTGESGPCATGVTECKGGTLSCKPDAQPVTETCNDVDDDCDGTVDDGNPGGGVTCATGLKGECANGTKVCMTGALSCIAPDPVEDVCDGKDNDCDGTPDNHGVGVGNPCMTALLGECKPGFTVCEMGALSCKQSKIAETEVCDNKDNDCDGTVDDGNPGGGDTCTLVGLKGACAVGATVCQAGIYTCTQITQSSAEVCDGIDNDCDGDVDETIACGTCGSITLATSACASMTLPMTVALTESCKQVFPPAATIGIAINEPGNKYYVSPTGNDNNDGTTPLKAWATLCRAVAAVPPGNTILVAQGAYLSSTLVVAKEVTIKGGYNSAFTVWNPDATPSIFYGRLTLDHAAAVWGGFRMIANPISAAQAQHSVKSGKFVRNYVETVFANSVNNQSSALDATVCSNGSLTLTGNDVYVGAVNASPLRAIGFNSQKGALILDSNRICAQGRTTGLTYAVNGFGPNDANAGSLLLRNNLLETATNGHVMLLAGQSTPAEFVTNMTNNTLLAADSGIGGTAALNGGKMRWRMTNNILYGMASPVQGTGVALGAGTGVSFDAAEHNLIFGFSNNLLTQPAPTVNTTNDTSNTATAASVFFNAQTGDFRIDVGGQADELGKNVYGLQSNGSVTVDLLQSPRPTVGMWDRGAIKN